MVDETGDRGTEASFALNDAVSNCNAAPGPIDALQNDARENDSWVYLKWGSTSFGAAGETFNCNWQGCYSSLDGLQSLDIIWSEIVLNLTAWQGEGTWGAKVYLIAHEMGHAFGLHHHDNDVWGTYLMRRSYSMGGGSASQAGDIGALPPCLDHSKGWLGVRCIYNWRVSW